jgi:predicted ATPase
MGRQSELEQIAALLDERPYRLITLHGPGGVGKTRLAVEAARRAHFDDGVYFVPLAPVMTVDFLPAAIAKSLPFYEDGPGDVRGRLIDALRERDVLLVLDNCEHLLAGADLVTLLLSNAPRVTILATSREPLNLQGEWVIDLFGLDFPERGPASGDTAGWDAHGAINLFMDRARRVRGDFTLEWHNRDAVREICALVDGLPLGLELAATWIRIMTPDQIVNEIRNSMDFLSTTLRDLPERHRSLRAVFEQSWQHLGENEQQHFSRMSMFTGPFSLEAAQSVAKTGPHILLTLVDKSLLRRNEDGLFEIHELIRQYAADKLTGDDRAEAEARYRSFYAGFLQRQLPVLRSGEELFALWHIGLAMNNIRNAWRMAVASGDRSFFRLSVDTLWHYYDVYRHAEEQSNLGQQAVEGLTAGVDSDDDLPDEDRLLLGRLLAMQLSGVRQMAHQSEVRQLALRCHHLIDAFPDRVETALPLILLAGSFNIPGQRNAEALAMTDNALHLFERAGDRWGQAFALANSGWTLQNSLRYQEVGAVAQRALSIFTALDHPSGLLVTYALLFENAVTFGDTDAARQYGTAEVAVLSRLGHDGWSDSMRFALHELNEEDPDPDKMRQSIEESIASYRMTGDRNHLAWTVYRLGWIHLYKDRFAEADTAYTEALGIFYELGDAEGIGWTLIFRAIVALELKRIVEARRLAEQALVEVEGTDLVWCVCGALYVLGDVELAEGNLDAARDNYLESIRIAHGVQSLLQTLRHLCGLADWMLHMGMTQQAVSLLTYIRMQPTSGLDTRRRARRLLEVAAEQMSHSGFRAAQSRGEKLTLDDALTVAEQV